MEKFQADVVLIPSRGSGKGDQSTVPHRVGLLRVSIPSRGSGKGDDGRTVTHRTIMFQSPLGEVVKETLSGLSLPVQAGGGDSFNPLSGKW